MRAYRVANNVDKACCKSILDAFDDKFLAARADPVVRYANETATSLITHLKECYAFISPTELVANYERMCQTYGPSLPIEDVFKQMQNGRSYAQVGSNLTGNNRSLTSRAPSFSTQESTEMHARSGKNMTFWRKQGKISKLTSQPSIDYTVSKLKHHKQQGTNQQITHNEACKMRHWWNSRKGWPCWQQRVQQIGPLYHTWSHIMPKCLPTWNKSL
jgi:hypothetical protein